MTPRKLIALLLPPTTLAILLALAGCGSDHHDYEGDRHRSSDPERRDGDHADQHRDGDRRDDDRGGR